MSFLVILLIMSTILLNTIPAISSKSLNIDVMRFIDFLNNNLLIIFSGSLVLGLFILYTRKRVISNTNSLSDNNLSPDLTVNNPNHNNNNNEPRTDGRDRIDRAFNYAVGTFGTITTITGILEGGLPSIGMLILSLGLGASGGMLGYHLNSDREESQILINRSESPPADINLNPHGQEQLLRLSLDNSSIENLGPRGPDLERLSPSGLGISSPTSDSTNNLITYPSREEDTSPFSTTSAPAEDNKDYSKDFNNVPSTNEDDNNLLNQIIKFLESIKDNGFSNVKEFFLNLFPSDGDPTMYYLFNVSVILVCILILILIVLFTLLVKMLKLEYQEFVKNRPLLYKIVLGYSKIKEIKIIILLLGVILLLLNVFIGCYFMWDSYWYYK